jgi:hypothetical protein
MGTLKRAWRELSPVQRVGVVLFEAAWVVQVGVLAWLFLR